MKNLEMIRDGMNTFYLPMQENHINVTSKQKNSRIRFRLWSRTLVCQKNLFNVYLLVFVAFLIGAPGLWAEESEGIKVAFRYDDYSSCSDTSLEKKVIDLFGQYKIPLTIGVIPYIDGSYCQEKTEADVVPLNRIKAELLRSSMYPGRIEVAMHGYSHKSMHNKTEFSGLPRAEQRRRLSAGKQLLKDTIGFPIATFIPPWGSYDRNTLNILEDLGFQVISGDERFAGNAKTKIKFAPANSAAVELKKKVKQRRRMYSAEALFVVVLHDYDFGPGWRHQYDFKEFEAILAWVAEQDDLQTTTISGLFQ